jgi:rSAM/selenodomain-associated transferase 1
MRPAVAVMAKVPGATPTKSRLHATLSPERATELYRCFLYDRLDALAPLDAIAPVLAFTPAEGAAEIAQMAPPAFRCLPQEGRDLGERLIRLLDGLLSEGHPGALAMDSDSPTLPVAYVLEAARTLELGAADLVLGPTDDGGYYLVGLGASWPTLFRDIPWSTPRVLATTLERAGALGLRVHLLPRWFDVDTEADLRRLHAELGPDPTGPPRTRAFIRTLYGDTPRPDAPDAPPSERGLRPRDPSPGGAYGGAVEAPP